MGENLLMGFSPIPLKKNKILKLDNRYGFMYFK